MKLVNDGFDANTHEEKHEIDSKMVEKLQELTLDDMAQRQNTVEVQPMLVRKTPKFPSRERHKAIRRKTKPTSPCDNNGKMFSFVGSGGEK